MTEKELNLNQLRQSTRHKEQEISEEFIKENYSFVQAIAAKIKGRGKVPPCIEFEDLVSWGVEGLLKAKKSYNPNLKTQFKTYAFYRINGEIMDKIRNEWNYRANTDYAEKKRQLQDQLADFIKGSIESSTESASAATNTAIEQASFVHFLSNEISTVTSDKRGMRNPEIEFIDESMEDIWDEIKKLSEDEREIINLFYVHGYKQIEVAKKMGYTASKVCRIHMKIIEKLKVKLKRERQL